MASKARDRSVTAGVGKVVSAANHTKAIGKLLSLLIVTGTLAVGSTASAQTFASLPESVSLLSSHGGARPVPAWDDFCARYPGECAVDISEPAVINLTAETWQMIVSVNRQVNNEIRPLTDQEQWGVVDSWDFPTTGYGDCEDYQLLKRTRLISAGLPRRALRMTVVLDERNEGHAVLKVVTNRGEYVLDNKTNAVLPWDRTGYVYIKREGHDSTAWVSLGGAVASPTAVATAQR